MKELGRQVYLGGYEHEEHAAEAYDVAALKCKGPRVKTNFTISRCAHTTFSVAALNCPGAPALMPLSHLTVSTVSRVGLLKCRCSTWAACNSCVCALPLTHTSDKLRLALMPPVPLHVWVSGGISCLASHLVALHDASELE